jgi:hypothetical protein
MTVDDIAAIASIHKTGRADLRIGQLWRFEAGPLDDLDSDQRICKKLV